MDKIDDLRRTFSYDPETGIVTRIYSPRKRFVGCAVGAVESRGYLQTRFLGRLTMVHHIAWALATGEWPKNEIDHRNRIKSDNKFCNLREATRQQNNWNTGARSGNRLGIKGVTLRKYDRFHARIKVDGKLKYLGSFKTLEEASVAYKLAAIEHRAEFSGV